MQAVCYLLYPNPTEKMKSEDGLKMVIDWWAASKKLLGRADLLPSIKDYDMDTIDEGTV